MATALARGFLRAQLIGADQIVACDSAPAAAAEFAQATGGRIESSNAKVVQNSSVVFLCVKPQQVRAVLQELGGELTANHLLISIAAGVRIDAILDALGTHTSKTPAPHVIRVMPNTPCLVGESASAYCLGPGATPADGALVQGLLAAVGCAYALDESLLDAVTGLSGSGPAFVYMMIEALSDGGVAVGLPRDIATALAAQTVKGGAEMVLSTNLHPGDLKDQVTSPGGTTIAGIRALEAGGLRSTLIEAVVAATRRSQELGKSPVS